MSFEPAHAEHTLAYEKAMRERNRMLKDGVRDPSWYAAVERQMAANGAKIERCRLQTIERISTAQASAETQFPSADLELVGADGAEVLDSEDGLAASLSDGRTQDMYAGRTLFGPHRDDLNAIYSAKNMAAKLCSTGEQEELLVSLVLANARALAQDFGASPILLLDEVAAHLDADRRSALYDEICALGTQAWMTGTGAELFEDLGDRALQLQVEDGQDGSRIIQR